MSEYHALLSPSGAHRWMRCPGSIALSQGLPDEETEYAAEGTFAHAVAAHCLTHKLDARQVDKILHRGKDTPVSREMQDYVQEYLDYVYAHGAGQTIMHEQAVEIGWLTGETKTGLFGLFDKTEKEVTEEEGEPREYATGTADAVIMSDNGEYMHVIDFKYGAGYEVDAEDNEQLQLYAIGALYQFSMFGDFRRVTVHIHQPRREHFDRWDTDIVALGAFAAKVKDAAELVHKALKSNSLEGYLNPGKKQCKFCPAKAICPALANLVAEETGADFEDVTQMVLVEAPDPHKALLKVDMLEMYAKAVRARVEQDLLAGRPSKFWKLVEGRKGKRNWTDEAEVEALCKSMRMTQDEMYKSSLKSVAQMEKLYKANAKRWSRLSTLIGDQKSGQPSVAPIADPRTTYVSNPSGDFVDVAPAGDDELVDDTPAKPKKGKK